MKYIWCIRIAKRRPVNKDVECNFVTTYSRCKERYTVISLSLSCNNSAYAQVYTFDYSLTSVLLVSPRQDGGWVVVHLRVVQRLRHVEHCHLLPHLHAAARCWAIPKVSRLAPGRYQPLPLGWGEGDIYKNGETKQGEGKKNWVKGSIERKRWFNKYHRRKQRSGVSILYWLCTRSCSQREIKKFPNEVRSFAFVLLLRNTYMYIAGSVENRLVNQ